MKVNKGIKTKIIILTILVVLIVAALLLMLVLPNKSKKVEPEPMPTPTVEIEATPIPTPEPTPTPVPTIDVDSNDSMTKVVNANNMLPADYVPSDLVVPNVKMEGEQQLRQEASTALEQMFAAAEAEGVYIQLLSGYRSYEYQESLYNTYVAKYGEKYANSIDSRPGMSEHQTGLAVDLSDYYGECANQACFEQYAQCTWLRKNAYKYGFIMSYQYGKETITGIRYSPWHWRYVGVEEATKIYESKQPMSQFYGK